MRGRRGNHASLMYIADGRTRPTWRRCPHLFLLGLCQACGVRTEGPHPFEAEGLSHWGPRERGIIMADAPGSVFIVSRKIPDKCEVGHRLSMNGISVDPDGGTRCRICKNKKRAMRNGGQGDA